MFASLALFDLDLNLLVLDLVVLDLLVLDLDLLRRGEEPKDVAG